MTSKFEQLIEYVINDEEAKAKELFHDIVVEKSREIYENLMNEEDKELDEAEEELDEAEEELDENMGGDASDDLIKDVETEEQGMQMEDDEDAEFDDATEHDGEELTHDIEGAHDEGSIEDRVVDLEDKLDELMAEFESLMGDEGGEEEMGIELDGGEGGDALSMDDTEEFTDSPEMMEENVSLAAAPKPVTSEPAGTNTKSTNANNSGAAGMQGAPVKMTGDTAQGRPAPKAGELIGKVQNTVGGSKKLTPAPKPVTAQASGVNTKTPFPKG
jgi:hypothetical protein